MTLLNYFDLQTFSEPERSLRGFLKFENLLNFAFNNVVFIVGLERSKAHFLKRFAIAT